MYLIEYDFLCPELTPEQITKAVADVQALMRSRHFKGDLPQAYEKVVGELEAPIHRYSGNFKSKSRRRKALIKIIKANEVKLLWPLVKHMKLMATKL